MRRIKPRDSVKLFISYAHEDHKLHEELIKHLEPLRKEGKITIWHDKEILPGDKWNNKIKACLKEANVILLLVSADFLNSRYCWEKEAKAAIERSKAEEAIAIPIILRAADWRNTPLDSLQALPTEAKPVAEWEQQDAALQDVVQGIRRVVEDLESTLKKASPLPSRPRLWHTIIMIVSTLSVLLLIGTGMFPQVFFPRVFADFAGSVIGHSLAAFIVLLVSAILIRNSRNTRNRRIEEMWDRKEETPFTVAAMGFQGVGKTTLLASMFYHLSLATKAGFILDIDADKRNELITIYDKLELRGTFPDKTVGAEMIEWSFSGFTTDRSHTLFQFTFLDYPGELAEERFKTTRTIFNIETEKQLQNADILWYILDGQEIRKFMDGKTGNNFSQNLFNLLSMMQIRAGKPVYFLLTKWDLLRQQYELDDIFKRLKRKNPQFSQFLENQPGKARFIPVSVGSFEEKADADDPGMKKTGSGQLQPFGVEIPLAYSTLEFFKIEIESAYPRRRKRWEQGKGTLPKRMPRNKREARKLAYRKLFHLVSEFERNNQN